MKRYNLLISLMLFSSYFFAQDIVGTWKYEQADTEVITSGDKLVADLIADNLKGLFKDSTLKFTADGKIYSGEKTGDYTINGNTIRDMQSGMDLKYSIKENILIVELDFFKLQKVPEDQFKELGIEKLILKTHFRRVSDDK